MIVKMALKEGALCPSKQTSVAAAFDLHALDSEILYPYNTVLVKTGLYIEIPPDHVGLVCPRSGLALQGITVANAPGVIDPDYRGDVGVILYNSCDYDIRIAEGDRVAQLLIMPATPITLLQVAPSELTKTERGEGGFGSTGV